MSRRSTIIWVAILTAVLLVFGYLVFVSTISPRDALALGPVINHLREIDGAKEYWVTENNITNQGTPMSETNVFPYMTLRTFVACFSNATDIQYTVNPSGVPPKARLLHRFVVKENWMTFKTYPESMTIRFTNGEPEYILPTK